MASHWVGSEMTGGKASVLQQIGLLWKLGLVGWMTDGQLLAQFSAQYLDGANLAFQAFVERRGLMIFRVCQVIIRHEHAAEDAFQVTFLVLARWVPSLWVQESLAGWLHSVAYRVASRVRSDMARCHQYEMRCAEVRGLASEVMPDCHRSDTGLIVSEEIGGVLAATRPLILAEPLHRGSVQATA
jgi:hypothetical protein